MCLAEVTNHMKQKEVGVREGAGHQFNPDMFRFKHSAEGGLGSNTKRPPQRHPAVSPKTNGLLWLGGITEKIDPVTVIYGIAQSSSA